MDKRPAEFTSQLMMARGVPAKKKPTRHKGHTGGYYTKIKHGHHAPKRKGHIGGMTGPGSGSKSYLGGKPGGFKQDGPKGSRALD